MLTKSKTNSKKALAASGLSLVLCFAMLLGTTFAWFSDSVSNKGNKITAGDLKIGFYGTDTDFIRDVIPPIGSTNQTSPTYNGWSDLKWSNKPIFEFGSDEKPVQPGDSITRCIAIRNEGSIPLKYYLDFVVDDGGLGDAVAFTFTEIKPNTGSPVTFLGSELEDQKINGSSATKSDFKIYKMELKFLESAGNTYQGGTFTVDLNLTATQDQEGARNALLKVKDATGFASATANSTVVLQKNIALTSDVTLSNCNIDLNGYTLDLGKKTLKIENAKDMVTADVEDGKIVDGKLVFNLPNGSASLSSALEDVECDVTVSSNTFVFSGKSNKEIVMNQGTIHIKSDNDVVITVPANAQNVVVEDKRSTAHKEIKVEVAKGATGTVVVQNPSNGGDVTVSGEGDVTVTPPTSNKPSWINSTTEPENNGIKFTITTAKELAWVSKAVRNGETFEGKTIELANDIDLAGKMWVPIGYIANRSTVHNSAQKQMVFSGSFKGNGYSVLNMEIVEHNVDKQLGLFGYVYNANIDHLKVTGKITVSGENGNFSDVGEAYHIAGLCAYAYEDTVITNCTSSVDIDASKITSLGGNQDVARMSIGGLVSSVEGSGQNAIISNCMNEGDILAPSAGSMRMLLGGILGGGYQPVISNVLNTGEVPAEEIESEYFSGAITATAFAQLFESDDAYEKLGLYSTTCNYLIGSAAGTDPIANPLHNQAFNQGTFNCFDFDSVWTMGSNGYPVLR